MECMWHRFTFCPFWNIHEKINVNVGKGLLFSKLCVTWPLNSRLFGG